MTILSCAATGLRAGPVDEAREKVDAGQYSEALRIISQALTQGRRADGAADDRYQLLVLKGESLLNTAQPAAAASAFDAAAKSAPDARNKAAARATALLVRASRQNKYTPKSGSGAIDIVEPESRKQAFSALREDLARTVEPKIDRVMTAKSLTPMIELLPLVLDLGYLEFAATGAADETDAVLSKLGSHARDLMNSEIRRIGHETDAREDLANSGTDFERRGLHSDERKALASAIAYLKQIEQSARDARRRATELGFEGKAWEPIIADAADQADRAKAVLEIGK